MKYLLLLIALLWVFSTIPCKGQATFKQSFINMPLASYESSPGLQPMGTPLSRTASGLIGVGLIVASVPVVLGGMKILSNSGGFDYTGTAGGAALIVLGGVSYTIGVGVLSIAIKRKE